MKLIHKFKSPSFNKRKAKHIKYIIIHYTALQGIDESINYLCNPLNKVRSHFLISKLVKIFNLVNLKKANNETLNETEVSEWKRIEERFHMICSRARDNSISVLIDAEESWIQNPVDELIERLTIKYNTSSCIVYNTIQAYRIDRLKYLKDLHIRLAKLDVKIGIKLVRGAYMEKERLRAKSRSYKSPICENKLKTDENFK